MNARSTPAAAGTAFPNLLSPLRFGAARLRNRIVMGAMHTRIEALDQPLRRIEAFYRARALGEASMLITGGVSPNAEGRLEPDAAVLAPGVDLDWHRTVADSVRGTDTLMCLQLLHAGRYAKFPGCVAPTALRARINRHVPRALSTAEVWQTVEDFAQASVLARDLGYHAVEIMGSEGYLINEFCAVLTNQREDEFGGSFENRSRFALEVVRAVRRAVGTDFPVMFRISALDLMSGGVPGDETLRLAALIEAAGADALNTGIGWHEATIPTIAQGVPRAGFAWATQRLKAVVGIPVMASNRINTPQDAEAVIAGGAADLVSLARPLLADAEFARKTRTGQVDRIAPCIACNQACLDRIFMQSSASCMVNPRAGHEIEFGAAPARSARRIAVVGAGPAGLAFSIEAARRGHRVTLFEAGSRVGGQLLLARAVPGKAEFDPLIAYFERELAAEGVDLRLGVQADAGVLTSGAFDQIVLAVGARPRPLEIPGADRGNVLSYAQVLRGQVEVGERVAIIGAGGIGIDTALYLAEPESSHGALTHETAVKAFADDYRIDLSAASPGGLLGEPAPIAARRRVTLLQRRDERLGARLGVTTSWIHRDRLKRLGVDLLSSVHYLRIDDQGLHVRIAEQERCLEVDHVVVCAGQESDRRVHDALQRSGCTLPVHAIGGADMAVDLDAVRAIDQAARLADHLSV